MATRGGLIDLRNTWLLAFAVTNCIWIILIYTLADKGEVFRVFGSNPIGLVALLIFGFVVLVQFIAMLLHRFSTLKHFLARAPYTRTTRKDAKSSADKESPGKDAKSSADKESPDDEETPKAGKGSKKRQRSGSKVTLLSDDKMAQSYRDQQQRRVTKQATEMKLTASIHWNEEDSTGKQQTRLLNGGDNSSGYGAVSPDTK